MKGSEKQVSWAEDIKASKDFDKFLGKGRDEKSNANIVKAINFVKGIDSAKFWIDYRNHNEADIFNFLLTVGLKINGQDHSRTAKMDKDGVIMIIEEVIVNDGKGGHYETKTEVV